MTRSKPVLIVVLALAVAAFIVLWGPIGHPDPESLSTGEQVTLTFVLLTGLLAILTAGSGEKDR